MATETLYATSHLAGDFLNPNNALGVADGVWAGDVNVNASPTSRWAIGNPVHPLTFGHTTHTVSVLARKGSNTGNPTVAVDLFENGTLVKALVSATTVTSTTGVSLSGTFATTDITNPNNIEVRVVVSGAAGGTTARNTAQVDAITVSLDTTEIAFVAGTVMKVWNGSGWVEGELKRWVGGVWNGAQVKRWDGSDWVEA
jgi:hypothetical protein